jgi:hypothetical protein
MLLQYLFNRFYFAAGDSLRDNRPLSSDWPVSSFVTVGYNIAVRALYKTCERRQKERVSPALLILPCAVDALQKLPERILSYLFVTKLLTGQ